MNEIVCGTVLVAMVIGSVYAGITAYAVLPRPQALMVIGWGFAIFYAAPLLLWVAR